MREAAAARQTVLTCQAQNVPLLLAVMTASTSSEDGHGVAGVLRVEGKRVNRDLRAVL
jgi:hypothetical protein